MAYLGKHEVNRRNKSADQSMLKPAARYQLVTAAWPAIIDEETFNQAQKLLEEAKRLERIRLKDTSARVYLITGLLRCGSCGAPLVGASSHGEHSVHLAPLETQTSNMFLMQGQQSISGDALK